MQEALLRVANIIEEGRWGGPQKRISLIAHALRSHDVETTVLLPNRDSGYFRECLQSMDIPHLSLPIQRLGKNPFTFLLYLVTFPFDILVLYRTLMKGKFALAHVSGGAWQIKGVLASRMAGIPVVWHLNDTSMPGMLVAIFRKLGRLSNAFFTASRRTRDYYLKFPEFVDHPAFLVPAPVDTQENNPDRAGRDESLDVYAQPRIVTLCNINPVKGLETLIRAASLLKKDMESLTILVVGKVPDSQKQYFQSLRELVQTLQVEDVVHFTGSREDIPAVLNTVELYVCSSVAESSPLAVWEAMAMKLPVVSTDVGDVPHYLHQDESGIIVPVGDHAKMAAAIKKVLGDKQFANKLGASAREVTVKELDTSVIASLTAQGYRDVYDQFMNTGKK